MNQEIKQCQNCKAEFTIEPADFDFYAKMKVPAPTWCPECRMQRRMTWRNERTFFRGACSLCNKNVVCMYRPSAKFKLLCPTCWWGDKWGGEVYAQEYNWNKSFLEQWHELMVKVPFINLWQLNDNVNSDYSNYASGDKDCYLVCSVLFCENVSYAYSVDKSKDVFDSNFVKNSERCYENIDTSNNYNSIFLMQSKNCFDSSFLFDCVDCKNCILSSNLRSKQYVVRNQQVSKTEYEEEINKIKKGSYRYFEELKKEFKNLQEKTAIHRYAQVINSVNSTGNNIENCKNTRNVFGAYNAENTKFGVRFASNRDVMDCYGVVNCELIYENVAPGYESVNGKFSCLNHVCRDFEYCHFCQNSSNIFGCVGLAKKQYCILNKQYTKEEYEILVPKIKEHMNTMPYIDKKGRVYKYGEFFPSELSPFAYNESIAQEYFPLTKEMSGPQGFVWEDPNTKEYIPTKTAEELPDCIADISEDIIKEVVQCSHKGSCNHQCTTAFRIIPAELQFYKKMNLSLPRLCPNCRHYERFIQRTPLKLWHRNCMNKGCQNKFETSYAPERPEIVYCEECYQKEVL